MALVSSDEAISVVVPIYNGECLLHRALDSILRQTFANWELLAVDDGSTDGTFQALQQYAARDCRIRVIRLPENSGLSAARNAAISEARADYVTYLDHDDEYYPDYLSRVAQLGDKADVLVFGYDVVNAETAAVSAWEPRQVQGNLFARNIVRPLGVAHRRELWARVGGFNEQLWREEDWDFWKRLARAGTEFVFVPEKSGRYYVRPDSLSRVPHLTRQQRESAIANHESGRPIFSTGTPASNTRPIRKIVYAAPHSLIDPTSGAAVATAQGMRFLQTLGFQCRAFCGSRLDLPEDMETVLRRHRIAYRHDTLAAGILRLPVLVASLDGFAPTGNVPPLEVTIFPNDRERQTEFYQACGAFLDADRPDAVVTYGGDPMAETVILLAKNRDLPLVFWLHNFAYYDPRAFASADYVIVPSQFNRRYYWESIGLSTQVLPLVFDWSRVQVAERRPQYLTFINPQTTKGLYVFARIAEQLAARRPDIPVLVMSGRSSPGWQHVTGIDLSKLPNLTVQPSVADPREFYAVTKLLLMPSLWNESFGLVAAEAMLNGIPVLASNRGALPETIGDAGFLFDIPARYTPETRELPTADEVEPWVETIIRLWDDQTYYDQSSRAARECAQAWHPDRLAPLYRDFFGSIAHQPGPPLVPRAVAHR